MSSLPGTLLIGSLAQLPEKFMPSFGQDYSDYYDALYSDKDYQGECDYIETLFRQFSSRKVRRVLDIACGTGGHAIPLGKRGYTVFGSDISRHMLAQAQRKVVLAGVEDRVFLKRRDMRSISEGGKFDACLCLFAAIGYLSTYQDILAMLDSVHKHLKENGLLIFDFWNGIAVLQVHPSRRKKRTIRDGVIISREAAPELDAIRNLCKVKYVMTVRGPKVRRRRFSEIHSMRFFYPEEIRLLLSLGGFTVASLHPFLRSSSQVSNKDWNITAIARAH